MTTAIRWIGDDRYSESDDCEGVDTPVIEITGFLRTGLAWIQAIRLNPAASHIGQAIPDSRPVLDSSVISPAEPQGFTEDVQGGVHVPVMRGPALLAHPLALGQPQFLVLVPTVMA